MAVDVRADALLSVTLAVFFVTCAVIFPVAAVDGELTSEDFHISTALKDGMGRRLGDIGLTCYVMVLALVFVARFCQGAAEARSLPAGDRLLWYNKAALRVGLVSVFGGVGVAAWPVSEGFVVHSIFALTCFGMLVLYQFISSYLDHATGLRAAEPRLWAARLGAACGAVLCFFAMAGSLGIFGSLFYSSVFELLTVAFCSAYFVLWLPHFATFRIVAVAAAAHPAAARAPPAADLERPMKLSV